jgi:hypothetical protein
LSNFSAKNLQINGHQTHQIAAHHFNHLPIAIALQATSTTDDNPNSFGDHYGFGRHAGLEGLGNCWHKICCFFSHFSAKNIPINSHQVSQIAAHPFHHLPMGLPDDNPSSFGDHYGFGRHAGLGGLGNCCHKICCFLSNFSDKNIPINSHQVHQIAAHPFHHLPMGPLYHMIIQAHLGIIMALDVMLGWED